VLLLVLDAMVAILCYVRKRTFLTTWPSTQPPARPRVLVVHVANTAMTVARRVTAALLEFATTTAAVATSTLDHTLLRPSQSCSQRRHSSTVSVPCTKTSRDTALFGLDIDGKPQALCGSCSTHLGDDDPRGSEAHAPIRNGNYQAAFFVFAGVMRLTGGLTSDVVMLLVSALLYLSVTHATVMLILIAFFPAEYDTCMQLGRPLCDAISTAASFTCTMRKRTIQAGGYRKYVRRATVIILAAPCVNGDFRPDFGFGVDPGRLRGYTLAHLAGTW
jgi:hypothetical protein